MDAAGAAGVKVHARGTLDTGESLNIIDGHLKKTFDCAGKDVNVRGGYNELTFRGACGAVNIQGAHNVIQLESASRGQRGRHRRHHHLPERLPGGEHRRQGQQGRQGPMSRARSLRTRSLVESPSEYNRGDVRHRRA
jgi:DUF3060 family protein